MKLLGKKVTLITNRLLGRRITEESDIFEPVDLTEIERLKAKIVVENGRSSVRELPLNKPVINLGRRDDNDIIFKSKCISRRHAKIIFKNGSFFIIDQNSANGTFLNAVRIKRERLSDGDLISLGYNSARLRYVQREGGKKEARQEEEEEGEEKQEEEREISREDKRLFLFQDAPALLIQSEEMGTSKMFPLNEELTIIGRDISNHIVLVDPTISRWHALLMHQYNHFVLYDLNSSNGTWVNNQAIKRKVLDNGDRIRFGDRDEYHFELQIEALMDYEEPSSIADRTIQVYPRSPEWEEIIAYLGAGIVIGDSNNQVLTLNKSAEELLGLDKERALSNNIWDCVPLEASGHLLELLKKYSESGIAQKKVRELPIWTKDKELNLELFPLEDRGGYYSGVLMFIKEKDNNTREVRDSSVPIEISHKLRSPLTAIRGAVEILTKDISEMELAEQRKFLSIIAEESERINAVISELLAPLQKAWRGDIAPLIRSVAYSFQSQAIQKDINLGVLIPSDLPKISGDRKRLQRVLNGLLSNSFRATPSGGRITISARKSRYYVEISISDTGEMIPEEHIKKIFEGTQGEFDRVTRFRKDLPLLRSIVEQQGGKLWAEQESGKRNKFILILPIEKAVSSEKGLIELAFRSAEIESSEAEIALSSPELEIYEDEDTTIKVPIPIPDKTILIADNEPNARRATKVQLEGEGFEVIEALNSWGTIAMARKSQPDLIILDILMPEMDGLQIIEVLKHDPQTKDIPILVVSEIDKRDRAFQLGVVGYLLKPIERRVLSDTTRAIFESKGKTKKGKILIVDDNPSIAKIIKITFDNLGYENRVAYSGVEALNIVHQEQPDLILLDIMMPGMNGYEVCKKLKESASTRHIPIVMLTSKESIEDKVRAMKIGADDYFTKSSGTTELGARVEMIIRRTQEGLHANPLTKLPGNIAVEREINRRIKSGNKFAVCYLDIDSFKAFNNKYGYAKGDGVIRQTASIITSALVEYGGKGDFVGHIGGDDFALITTPDKADNICSRIIEVFDELIPHHYREEDQKNGYIITEDRDGKIRQFPIISISIAVVTNEKYDLKNLSQISQVAAELETYAKTLKGSVYVKDRRKRIREG